MCVGRNEFEIQLSSIHLCGLQHLLDVSGEAFVFVVDDIYKAFHTDAFATHMLVFERFAGNGNRRNRRFEFVRNGV